MGWEDEADADAQFQRDARRADAQRRAASAKQETAQRLTELRKQYPWLTPGAATSLARAGHGADSMQAREVARRAAERKKKKGFGWHSIGDVVGGAADVVGDAIGVVGRGAKTGVRATATVLETGAQLVDAQARDLAKMAGLGRDDDENASINPSEGLKATNLGVIADKWAKDERVDLGTGFFAGGEVREEQARRAREHLSIDGHAATPGRIIAYTFTEPGTTAYNWTSGIVDAIVDIGADPAAAGLSKVGQVARARKLIDPSAAGAIKGTRVTALPELAQSYLTSPAGRKFTEFVAGETSAFKIYNKMKRRISAEEAGDLAALSDPDEIVSYITPKLGTSIRAKPYAGGLVSRTLQPVGGFSQIAPESVRKRLDGVRMFHQMPGAHVDPHNSSEVAEAMADFAYNAKLPELAESAFNRAAAAKTPIERWNVVTELVGDVSDNIVSGGTNPKLAKQITTMYRGWRDQAAAYWVDEVGENVPVLGATIDNHGFALPTPHQYSEYVNRAIPLPDARAIRRATSKYGRALSHLGKEGRPIPVAMLDFAFQDVWKPLVLIRGAWTVRVVGEEQVRMAAAGLDSVFRHPLSAIAWITGRKGSADVLGKEFDALDDMTEFARSQSRRGGGWRDQVAGKHRQAIRVGADGFEDAWAMQLAKGHADPIVKRLAGGLGEGDLMPAAITGNPLTDVQNWFWEGTGRKFRKELADAKGREELLTNRQVADDLVKSWNDRLQQTVAGNQRLKDAVAFGKLDGESVMVKTKKGYRPSPKFLNELKAAAEAGTAPRYTVGDLPIDGMNKTADRVVDTLFDTFMSRPTNRLSRSPAFRQMYYRRVAELLPAMTEDAQVAVLRAAREAGIGDRMVKRMVKRAAGATGDLDADDADFLAKGFALDETKKLLYDLSKKNQFFDITRHIFPFGEAWKEVLGVWAKVGMERPQIPRRAQVIIEGARDSGFFAPDENGEEVFSYPGSGLIAEKFTGVPVEGIGRVAGLNIFSNNPLIPGFGPMVQIPASAILPDKPSWDVVRDAMLPFGDPKTEGGALESFLPPWLQKVRQATGHPFGRQDDRVWANSVKDAARSLQSTGDPKFNDPAVLEREAKELAKKIYLLRAAGSFFTPSPPSPEWQAKDPAGNWMASSLILKEWRALQKKDRDNNTDAAVETFLATYGPDAFLFMQGKSEGNGPLSPAGFDWTREHAEFVKRYPETFGLFAPDDEGFDSRAYERLIEQGKIKNLTFDEWVAQGNNRVGALVFRQAQAAVGEKRTKAEAAWLRDVKERLRQVFPGYDDKPFDDKRTRRQIDELKKAVWEPDLDDEPAAQGVKAYLKLRDEALAEAKKRGRASFVSSNDTRNLRDWLRSAAGVLAERYKGFDRVFDEVFDREMADDDEQEAAA